MKKFSDIEILEKICVKKLERLNNFGFSLGFKIPKEREVPLITPFIMQDSIESTLESAPKSSQKNKKQPFIIAEIKRASPTAGSISAIKEPINLAKTYVSQGANAISVLCEQDFFKGSLKDLQDVKNALPNACVLRKDFILHEGEVEISYKMGADMLLIIAAIFLQDFTRFRAIMQEILRYKMTPLLEIHNLQELEFAMRLEKAILRKTLLGINSRNLRTFKINAMDCMRLRARISQDFAVIFESGIESSFDSFIAASSGFSGILCGSYLVRNLDSKDSNVLNDLKTAFVKGLQNNFLERIVRKFETKNRTLIKICGINNIDFLSECVRLGADLLGFILTKKSARYVDIEFLQKANEKLENLKLDSKISSSKNHNFSIKVGVVTKDCIEFGLKCLESGLLDCLQLHDVPLEFVIDSKLDSKQDFKVENGVVDSKAEIFQNRAGNDALDSKVEIMENSELNYKNPKILYDNINLNSAFFAFYPSISTPFSSLKTRKLRDKFILFDSSGGCAKSLDIESIKDFLAENEIFKKNLWLAGGISTHNLKQFLNLNPMLIDICSSLESTKGVKDITKLREFFDSYEKCYKNV